MGLPANPVHFPNVLERNQAQTAPIQGAVHGLAVWLNKARSEEEGGGKEVLGGRRSYRRTGVCRRRWRPVLGEGQGSTDW